MILLLLLESAAQFFIATVKHSDIWSVLSTEGRREMDTRKHW
jgi:hypothetical protein